MTAVTVSSGQTSTGLSLTRGDTLTVLSGGTVSSATLLSGAYALVSGTAVGTVVSGGSSGSYLGSQTFSPSSASVSGRAASISNTQVLAGAQLNIVSGSAAGTYLSGSDATGRYVALAQEDLLAATDTNATIASGGSIRASDYAAVGNATVLSGGSLYVDFYTTAANTTVYAGGVLSAGPAGTTVATVLSGGTETIAGTKAYYTSAVGTTILAGGTLIVGAYDAYNTYAVGTTVSSGGTLSFIRGGINSTSIAGGTVEQGRNAQIYDTLSFTAPGGTLRVDDMTMPSGVISGFTAQDRIVLAGLPADPAASVSVSGDMVTVSAGGQAYALDVAGASAIPFTLGIGSGSTGDIVIACYCRGTRVLTARGEVPVETLAIGDMAITASGRRRPIRWIGRRSYAGRFLAANPGVQPIRFRAGSLGNGLPRRDLLVSPEHGMLLDGVLVPARLLVNGSTVVPAPSPADVDYFHVELDGHDVILAEGAPSETFLDDDSRAVFHNAAEYAALYPHAAAPGCFCAPRVENGYALEAIRGRLTAVAEEMARAAA